MENQESIYEEKQGNLLTGILGALLGALIGTALWVLVGVWGYIASIVAWLTAFLAGKGYELLHGRPGKAKTITIIVMRFCRFASVRWEQSLLSVCRASRKLKKK